MINYINKQTMDDICNIVDKFICFLRTASVYGGYTDWHVIFQSGTVIRFDLNSGIEFTNFDENTYDKDIICREIVENNIIVYQLQKDILPDDFGKALRIAYNILLSDGCENIYTDFTDLISIPCENIDTVDMILWITKWIKSDERISNLSIANDYTQAQKSAINCRLFDYIFPKVFAVISPNLDIAIIKN